MFSNTKLAAAEAEVAKEEISRNYEKIILFQRSNFKMHSLQMYTAPSFLPIADITFIVNYLFDKEGCGTHVKHHIVKLSSMLMFACQHIFYLISFLYTFYVAMKKTKLI